MLLPMLGACFCGVPLPRLLRNPPIYVSLREHTLRLEQKSDSDEFGAIHRKRLVMGREVGLDMPATYAHPQPRNDE